MLSSLQTPGNARMRDRPGATLNPAIAKVAGPEKLRSDSKPRPEAGGIPRGVQHMIRKFVLPALAATMLAGCVTGYTYRGAGGGGDYYHGQPSVEYRYYGGYGGGYYGGYYGYPYGYGGAGYYGYPYRYGYYGYPYAYPRYPVYRYPYRYDRHPGQHWNGNNNRPPHWNGNDRPPGQHWDGHGRPPQWNGNRPPNQGWSGNGPRPQMPGVGGPRPDGQGAGPRPNRPGNVGPRPAQPRAEAEPRSYSPPPRQRPTNSDRGVNQQER